MLLLDHGQRDKNDRIITNLTSHVVGATTK